MNADAFRHLYAYHFAANRKIWDDYIVPLSMEKFTQDHTYSIGSVRNQLVHMMEVEQIWFTQIRHADPPQFQDYDYYDSKEKLRVAWDTVEATIQIFLDTLQDNMLFDHVPDEDTDELVLWQVMLHVANHGTDHRAQTLALLNSLGVKTEAQDYIFYIMGQL